MPPIISREAADKDNTIALVDRASYLRQNVIFHIVTRASNAFFIALNTLMRVTLKATRTTRFDWVSFYGISTIAGYLMLNPLYIYIKFQRLCRIDFYGISTIVGYLMLNPLYT